jgi:hypothetical protein
LRVATILSVPANARKILRCAQDDGDFFRLMTALTEVRICGRFFCLWSYCSR